MNYPRKCSCQGTEPGLSKQVSFTPQDPGFLPCACDTAFRGRGFEEAAEESAVTFADLAHSGVRSILPSF